MSRDEFLLDQLSLQTGKIGTSFKVLGDFRRKPQTYQTSIRLGAKGTKYFHAKMGHKGVSRNADSTEGI